MMAAGPFRCGGSLFGSHHFHTVFRQFSIAATPGAKIPFKDLTVSALKEIHPGIMI
jgi:hypothetical protein